jgi:hypothetical protein
MLTVSNVVICYLRMIVLDLWNLYDDLLFNPSEH